MNTPDRDRVNDSFMSDKQYRAALREFANAEDSGDTDSLQSQEADLLHGSAAVPEEAGKIPRIEW
ncbi:hypothetical protein HQN89_21450 [Paenibacillus frigoriresistens]|uniref:hypothetical protein n=1 Tax=Paenibacillus alginolyticus TaxID=59839 RepID=UPI001566A71E|nr:hypothetical protein [Paenibacillus frigoriresistens]NRF93515.1 hypothetical protein [Paenibacillus frigoriresistens]